jgi:pimeloyl-ACP methyl ester carboxylesterase
MTLRLTLSTWFHRFLRIPYILHTEVFRAPKKPKATYVLIHGIGNTLHSWDEVVQSMPNDVRIIGIDLLGFGKSPRPTWAVYSAKTQARSVALTLLSMRLVQQPILVGHSLGALVAVEVAKLYPFVIKELILCSPPFYEPEITDDRRIRTQDDMLRFLYRLARKHPERLEKYSPKAVKLGLANRALNITSDTVGSYMAALESSIINQTALQDIRQLKLPITIFYGALDPVVVAKHITKLANEMPNITIKRLLTGHEIVGSYVKSVATYISNRTKPESKNS